jgi:hypothetical protein
MEVVSGMGWNEEGDAGGWQKEKGPEAEETQSGGAR